MRSKGTFNISSNYEPRLKAPFDARQVANTFSDLINPSTWVDSDSNIWLYNGAFVGVSNDSCSNMNGIYLLLDSSNYINTNSWVKTGTRIVTASNIGTGDVSIFSNIVNDNLKFRTLKAGFGVVINTSGDTITIDASGGSATVNIWNGLEQVNSSIGIGGRFYRNTTLDVSTYNFNIKSGDACIYMSNNYLNLKNRNNRISFEADTSLLVYAPTGGLKYGGAYENTFTDLTLPDVSFLKSYVRDTSYGYLRNYLDGSLSLRDQSIQNIYNSVLDLSIYKIKDVSSSTLDISSYDIVSNKINTTVYLKNLVAGTGVSMIADVSSITINSIATGGGNVVKGTFNGSIDTSLVVTAGIFEIGEGPFITAVYDNKSLVHVDVEYEPSTYVKFIWTLGMMSASCSYIIIG